MTNPNDPAFPAQRKLEDLDHVDSVKGLTKREHFAAMAMQGILVGMFGDRPRAQPTPEKVAAQAVMYADALCAELRNSPYFEEPCPTPKA